MPSISVVIYGLGRMGQRHLQAVRALGGTVTAAVDPDESARGKAATDFDLPHAVLHCAPDDADAALPGADLVVVATTAPAHAELVHRALDGGAMAILCEKPMATSLAAAEAMVARCAERGVPLAVNHQMRALAHYAWLKDTLAEAAMGPLAALTLTAGNFGLAMNASHYFELFRYLTGARAATVSAWFDGESLLNPRGSKYEDRSGCVRALTACGKRLYLDFSADQGLGLRLTATTRNGQLFLDELDGSYNLTVRRPEHGNAPTTQYALPAEGRQGFVPPTNVAESTRRVIEAVLDGGDFPTGEDGLDVMRCLVAAHLSHEVGGAPVAVSAIVNAAERVFPWA